MVEARKVYETAYWGKMPINFRPRAFRREEVEGAVDYATRSFPDVLDLVPDFSVLTVGKDLDRFVLAKPEVGLRMMDLLAERLGQSNERMAELAHKEVLTRLAGQVLRLLEGEGLVDREGGYRLPAAYTHEELGAMVGANRVAVTRALGRLQEEGAVELRRRVIHVGDREALQRVAEQGR